MTSLNTDKVSEYQRLFEETDPSDAVSRIRDDIGTTKILLKGYELKLKCLRTRDPRLSVVKALINGCVDDDVYKLHEEIFEQRKKDCLESIDAADHVLNLAPKRRYNSSTAITVCRNSFMMDFENACLSDWDSSKKPHPTGCKRYLDPEWAALVKSQVYPYHSDIDWYEYCSWVSRGHGDTWFQPDSDSETSEY